MKYVFFLIALISALNPSTPSCMHMKTTLHMLHFTIAPNNWSRHLEAEMVGMTSKPIVSSLMQNMISRNYLFSVVDCIDFHTSFSYDDQRNYSDEMGCY